MIRNSNFLEKNRMFIILISAFSLLRIFIGMHIPIWIFTDAKVDDGLMLNYSHLYAHLTQWDIISLVKGMSYPLFLCFVRLSKLSYRFWISILWILAAFLVMYGIYKFLTKNKTLLLLIFLFILFLPIAFDVDCGLRVYRNAIMTPCATIFLASLFIFINKLLNLSKENIKNTIIWAIILGFAFTFNYYIKEDGITTLPIFLASILIVLIFIIYDKYGIHFTKSNSIKIIKISVLALLPIIIFAAGTISYEEVNYHYFGVHEINTRTNGELGEFYHNLLMIDDNNKTTEILIPASTVEKAYDASPTLQSQPEFINKWLNKPWADGVLINSTMRGDFPSWSLRYSLNESGLFDDEKTANELFYNVNNELDQAFNSGVLNKSDKIFITNSLNGKNIDEIFELTPDMISGTNLVLFYDGLTYNNEYNKGTSLVSEDTENIESDLNDQLTTQKEFENLPLPSKIPFYFINLVGILYHIISYFILLISVISFILLCYSQFKNQFKNRNNNILIIFCILLIGTLFVQIFSVVWFCSWMEHPFISIKTYLVSSYGFYIMFLALSIAGLYSQIEITELERNTITNNYLRNTSTPNNNIYALTSDMYTFLKKFINENELFLLGEIIKKNFFSKYKDSVLGIIWTVLNPLLMTLLFTIIFSTVFGRNIENYALYFLCGRCIFEFFDSGVNAAMNSIKGNKNILQRTAAPKYVFVLGGIFSEYITFIIYLILLFGVIIVTNAQVYLTIPLAIIPIVSLTIMTIGLGLILSILCVYYTDVQHLWKVFSTLLLYASAIFYPMDIIPEPFHKYMVLNPVFWIIDQFRCFIYGGTIPNIISIMNSLLLSTIILILGIIIFKKYEKKVAMRF